LKVKKYLDENPKASILEVSTETEVTQKQIKKFIEEGRLMASEYSALNVECSRCGAEISQGKYCEGCKQELQGELDSVKKDDKPEKEEKKGGGKIHIQDRLSRRDR